MKVISLLIVLVGCAQGPFKPKDPIDAIFHDKDFVYRQCLHESDSYKGRFKNEERSLDVKFMIETNGYVKKVEIIRTDFKDPNFHTCILSMVKNLRFDDMKERTEVTKKIDFKNPEL